MGVMLTVPVGAPIILKLTNTQFSASSGLGLIVPMGAPVETAVTLFSSIDFR
jgi:hypothetical protein